MQFKINVGCDISKEKLDFYCWQTEEYFVLSNSAQGLEKLSSWLNQHEFDHDSVCLIFEHTGRYGKNLSDYCKRNAIAFFQIPALEIKKSLGITRGKNDRIDARRICQYFIEKGYKLKPSKPVTSSIERLSLLKAHRALYVKHRAAILSSQKDLKHTLNLSDDDSIVQQNIQTLKVLSETIRQIENEIQLIICQDQELKMNFNLLNSIVGIGPVIALHTILATGNFEKFNDWRKFASYCGCAPFENSSGKFVGKSKTSPLANKFIKAHLTSGARSAVQFDPGLKAYYEKKIQEGKKDKCVINVIRCKLIARMFAIIRRKEPFEKNYQHPLAQSVS